MVLAEEERSEPVGSAEFSVNQVGNLVKIHSKYSLENFLKLWCKSDFIVKQNFEFHIRFRAWGLQKHRIMVFE